MRVKVGTHKIELIKEQPVNEKEIDVSKCYFEFDEEITDDYVKEALFTLDDNTYKQIIVNNECSFPGEILDHKGDIEIGVVAYKVENEEEIKRYNPSPAYFNTWAGSLKDANNSEPITPSEMEQYEQALQDGLTDVNEALIDMRELMQEADTLDIDVSKTGSVSTVDVTKKDGTIKTVFINDGINGRDGIDGKDGKDGVDGKDGKDGQPGPAGPEGKQGQPGQPGPAGADGKDGKDGQDGRDGQDGQDGYTPVKGVDYFTQADIASLNIPDSLSDLSSDSTHRVVTDTEKTTWNGKQDTLISGTNIKTINNISILGSGDITISGGSDNAVKYLGDVHDYSTQQTALNLNELEVGCYIMTGVDSDWYVKATYQGQTLYGNFYIPDTILGTVVILIFEQVSDLTVVGTQIGMFNFAETSYYSLHSQLLEMYLFGDGISMGGGISYDYPTLDIALGNLPVLGTNTTQVLKNIDGYVAWDDDGVSSALGGSY